MKAGKQLTGKVVKKDFAKGSKSEHKAVCLETTEGTYVLRRQGGNPFSDPELNKLIGKNITATGITDDYLFIASNIQQV